MRIGWLLAGCVAVASCGVDLRIDVGSRNATPFASAGTGGDVLIGTTVALDGSASFDPDGSALTYTWFLLESPDDSSVTIVGASTPVASLLLDVAGEYIVELRVTDDRGAVGSSRLRLRAVGPAILVNAGADQATAWRGGVQLTGTVQAEAGVTPTTTWTIVSRPAGSTVVLTGADTLTPSFVADREGAFVLRLTAESEHTTDSDEVTVTATVTRQILSYDLVDVEYSKALARFVIVSAGPGTLRRHDPATGTEATVALGFVPKAVGVSPDGLRAAVAHSGKVSIVDLQTMSVSTVYTVTHDVNDIVWSASNLVQIIGDGGFAVSTMQTINLTNGNISSVPSLYPDAGAKARLHPSGAAIYTGQYGGSPTHLYRYNVSSTPATYSRDWPYHGEYDAGYNLWIVDSATIVAASGGVFHATTDAQTDMTYRGTLAGQVTILWAGEPDDGSKIATLGVDYDANFANVLGYNVRLWNAQTLAQQAAITLPDTSSNQSAGVFAAFNAAGTTLYAITKATTTGAPIYALYPVPL